MSDRPDDVPETGTVSKAQIEAITVLINAVQVAQSKGCFTLDEASVICQAVRAFVVEKKSDDGQSVKK